MVHRLLPSPGSHPGQLVPGEHLTSETGSECHGELVCVCTRLWTSASVHALHALSVCMLDRTASVWILVTYPAATSLHRAINLLSPGIWGNLLILLDSLALHSGSSSCWKHQMGSVFKFPFGWCDNVKDPVFFNHKLILLSAKEFPKWSFFPQLGNTLQLMFM